MLQEQKEKGRKPFGSRLLRTIALAAVFGLVAGVFFQIPGWLNNGNAGGDARTTAAEAGAGTSVTVSDNIGSASAKTGTEVAPPTLFDREEPELARMSFETLTEEAEPAGEGGLSLFSETEGTALSGDDSYKGNVVGVVRQAMPSVVAITSVSVKELYSFFGFGTERYNSASSGSGIIVGENEEELLIATNNHVVEGATTVTVCFAGNDAVSALEETSALAGNSWDVSLDNAVEAHIKGTDPEDDLAVVAVSKEDLSQETLDAIRIVQLGDSDQLEVGEQVVAIGNALGYGQSVTSGWISALNRSFSDAQGLIQTDAAINPGNSGGALLNMKGELVGINTAKYANTAVEGMGYAIPLSKALPILEDLMSRETRVRLSADEAGYMGVTLADLSRQTIRMYGLPAGAFVIETAPGGAADAGGILEGDIITALDGQTVTSRDELISLLQYYAPGEEIAVQVSRAENGAYVEQTLQITLGTRP